MFNTGFLLPTDGLSIDSGSSGAWSNVPYIYIEDTEIYFASLRTTETTDTLVGRAYDFSDLPIDAFILGIEIQVHADADFYGEKEELLIQLTQGTTLIGENKSTGTVIPASWTNMGYGGSSDLWGTTLTAEEIKESNIGVALRYTAPTGKNKNIKINTIRMKVYYLTGTSPLSLSAF